MTDTSIGYAVLQIIPSLKGVTDAINKQIAGQVVPVTIEPKFPDKGSVGRKKFDKNITDAVKKAPVEIPVETKIDGGKVREQTKEVIKQAGQEAKSSPIDLVPIDKGKVRDKVRDIGQSLRDGLREINNNPELRGLGEQAGQEIGRAIGEKIGQAVGDSPVGEALRNIRDEAQPVVDAVGHVRDALDNIKGHDAAGAITGIQNALRDVGQSGVAAALDPIGTKTKEIQDVYASLKGNISDTTTNFLGLTNNSGKIAGGLSVISAAAGPLAAVFTTLDTLMPGFDTHLNNIVNQLKGLQGFNPKDWVNVLAPGTNLLDQLPIRPNSPTGGTNAPTNPDGTPRPGIVAPPPIPPTSKAPSWLNQIPGMMPGHAGGGSITGPGSGTSDSIIVRASNGEWLTNAEDTRKNRPLLEAVNAGVPLWDWIKSLPRFATGGQVGQPDVVAAEAFAGTPYNQSTRTDCSGMVARVILRALGRDSGGGLMTTKNAEAWLSALGFHPGTGGAGSITVGWYDRGPNPNDGHMAMTLSDGTHAEAGGQNSVFTLGAKAHGGGDPEFDHHMFLPIAFGEGPTTGPQTPAVTPAGMPAAASPASQPAPAGASGSPGGSGGFSIPTSLSGMAGFALSGLGGGIGTTSGGSDLSLFGNAASAAVGGQVSSALGAFGVSNSPQWLQGISKFVGGISFGGQGSGGGAIPASLRPVVSPAGAGGLPDGVQGAGGGRPPGSGPVYNIRTATVEDAFLQAQRRERERAAAKLDKF